MEISCIICAYNEGERILEVLNVAKEIALLDEIIVVNDGSTDNTKEILSKIDRIKLIDLEKNMGKGDAMQTGIENSNGEIILFLDADLKGLTKRHIEDLLEPIIRREVDMTLSFRDNSGEPLFGIDIFSGERVLRREILEKIDLRGTGYGVEAAINKFIVENGYGWKSIKCRGLKITLKEEKFGLFRGLFKHYRMYWHINKRFPGQFFMWFKMGLGQKR